MSKSIVVTSSNPSDTLTDIEERLQKAVSAMKEQQESRQLPDKFLMTQHQSAAKIVDQTINSMLDEIADVLNGGD